MLKLYRPFAALHDDTDKGWVWVLLDPEDGYLSRSTIRIQRGNRTVYCEHRNFDANFVRRYDSEEETRCMYFPDKPTARRRGPVELQELKDVIVISSWYRSALGGFESQASGGEAQELNISKPRIAFWADLRAGCHHPEPIVRITTRLALLGAWLGMVALLLAIASIKPIGLMLEKYELSPELVATLVGGAFGLLCVFAGRGVKRTVAQYRQTLRR